MDILFRILIAVEVIVCILLIGIVLIQRSKGQGVGLSFGGGAEAIFGAQMGNVLTRATVVLGVIFLLNTAVLAIIKPTGRRGSLAERTPVKVAETVDATPVGPDADVLDFFDEEPIEVPLVPADGVVPVDAAPEPAPAALPDALDPGSDADADPLPDVLPEAADGTESAAPSDEAASEEDRPAQ